MKARLKKWGTLKSMAHFQGLGPDGSPPDSETTGRSQSCCFHDRNEHEPTLEAQAKDDGRPVHPRIIPLEEFDLTDPEQVRHLVSSTANRLIRGDSDSRIAQAVIALASYLRRLNNGGEQAAAVAEYQRVKAARKAETSRGWVSKLSGAEIRRLLTTLWSNRFDGRAEGGSKTPKNR